MKLSQHSPVLQSPRFVRVLAPLHPRGNALHILEFTPDSSDRLIPRFSFVHLKVMGELLGRILEFELLQGDLPWSCRNIKPYDWCVIRFGSGICCCRTRRNSWDWVVRVICCLRLFNLVYIHYTGSDNRHLPAVSICAITIKSYWKITGFDFTRQAQLPHIPPSFLGQSYLISPFSDQ
jgi:hypothetical protein